jgi:uroporphyrinogen decarboxylase
MNLVPHSRSKMATLTSRERVNRMMERRDQDRIPRHESFWPDTIRRWKEEGLAGDAETVWAMLESDFQSVGWCWPAPFPGGERTLSEDHETKIVRDQHGKLLRHWTQKSGTPEHLGFECDSREIWESKFKPALLEKWMQYDLPAVKERYDKAHAAGKWTHFTGVEPFEETRALMGDEISLIAMATEPEWIEDVAVTFTDIYIRNLDAAYQAGIHPDGLWIYGDMAFKSATMCSPSMYRELIWPQHQKLAAWAHARGMKLIYHTDGNVNGVIDLYLEAGFDCLQPLETKANMDIRKLCPVYGKQISFMGNIDVMKMITNDMGQIEEEIVSKFSAGKATKGYCYHSDHSVPPQVSWKTYQNIIALVKKNGEY